MRTGAESAEAGPAGRGKPSCTAATSCQGRGGDAGASKRLAGGKAEQGTGPQPLGRPGRRERGASAAASAGTVGARPPTPRRPRPARPGVRGPPPQSA